MIRQLIPIAQRDPTRRRPPELCFIIPPAAIWSHTAASDEPANVEHAHQLVYTARIALEEKSLVIDGKPLELAPGMAVVTESKTGKRRVLDYLLSPLHHYGHDVLRER